MKEEYQTPVLEELDSTLDCQVVAGNSPGLGGDEDNTDGW